MCVNNFPDAVDAAQQDCLLASTVQMFSGFGERARDGGVCKSPCEIGFIVYLNILEAEIEIGDGILFRSDMMIDQIV